MFAWELKGEYSSSQWEIYSCALTTKESCMQDVIKLGNSSREYVLLHEGSLNP